MTSKQILDSFSETLMQDERIFSAQERFLVATLLQHAKAAAGENQETREAVRAVIASAVGETVAQRAFAVLGGSIVERILEDSSMTFGESAAQRAGEVLAAPKDPQSPGVRPLTGPQSPGRSMPVVPPAGPQSPGKTPIVPPAGPQSPGRTPIVPPAPGPQSPGKPLRAPAVPAPGPQSPGHGGGTTTVIPRSTVAVAEQPQTLPAKCVVLDEFLAPQELQELTRFTLEHESDFQASEVISPTEEHGIVNYEHRRSRVLMDLAKHQELILDRIKAVLPQVLNKLGMEEFSIAEVEAQVTASNDGDFFRFHADNSSEQARSRHLTFVYFFHREPRQFEGGELRIHDARLEEGVYVSQGSFQTIVPQQNQIVFFPCELLHEITPVKCSSQSFADSRFTLNGWLRQ